jgi:EAL domain-containing protein (putative c-di-GMP-specific phosphodiesterase class I)
MMKSQLMQSATLTASADHCAFALHRINMLNGRATTFGSRHDWFEVLVRPYARAFSGSPIEFIKQLYKQRPPEQTDSEVLNRAVDWLIYLEQPTRVSINIHPISLTCRGFVDRAIQAQQRLNRLGHSICLELIEFGECPNRMLLIDNANWLRANGLIIVLDDFGSRINCFDLCAAGIVDVIKIDTSVINRLHRDRFQRAVVESIQTLGNGIGATVVAEGVESSKELDVLRNMGVEFAQGYFFHKPEIAEI